MGIMNRRNAFLGWVAWNVAKRVVKRKAKAAVPAVDTETKRPNRAAALLGLVLAAVAGWVSYRWLGGEDDDGEALG